MPSQALLFTLKAFHLSVPRVGSQAGQPWSKRRHAFGIVQRPKLFLGHPYAERRAAGIPGREWPSPDASAPGRSSAYG